MGVPSGVDIPKNDEKILKDIMKSPQKAALIFQQSCMRRALDTSLLVKFLERNGWRIVSDANDADKIFISTCAYSSEKENAAIKLIERIRSSNRRGAELVICGCLGDINRRRLAELGSFVVVGPRNLERLNDIIEAEFPIESMSDANTLEFAMEGDCNENPVRVEKDPQSILRRIFNVAHTVTARILHSNPQEEEFYRFIYRESVYKIRIARGCLGDCSYCAIKFSTGALESKPLQEIIRELERGLGNGFTEFCLIADDVGCYGIDLGLTLIDLLDHLFSIEGDFNVWLFDTNINWIMKYLDGFDRLLRRFHGRIPYIIMPIQSASDHVLERMNRHYSSEDIHRCLAMLRDKHPGVRIGTHFLVGFPGETGKDFKTTLNVARNYRFDDVCIFAYTDRPGTASSLLTDKVPAVVRYARRFRIQKAIWMNQIWRNIGTNSQP